jgi:CheY-like chemotaxis protein
MLYNVLIVEDDRQMAQSLAAQIGVMGHTVVIAYGPRVAIRQLTEVIPDVIFMDINMPGVDGLEVLRFLRRDPATMKVPVIIVSAEDQDAAIQAALEAGANYYIVKPPMMEDIEKALNTAVRLDPTESAETLADSPSSAALDQTASSVTPPDPPGTSPTPADQPAKSSASSA